MPKDRQSDFPASLVIAEKWAKEMGKTTQRGEAVDDQGIKSAMLAITHGDKPVYVRENNSCISVFILIEIPSELRKKISELPKETQLKLQMGLRHELLSNARTGFAFIPPKMESMASLEKIVIEQLLRISKDSTASFNRYSDAIQEVVTTAVRAMSILGILLMTESASTGTSGDKGVPPGMYA